MSAKEISRHCGKLNSETFLHLKPCMVPLIADNVKYVISYIRILSAEGGRRVTAEELDNAVISLQSTMEALLSMKKNLEQNPQSESAAHDTVPEASSPPTTATSSIQPNDPPHSAPSAPNLSRPSFPQTNSDNGTNEADGWTRVSSSSSHHNNHSKKSAARSTSSSLGSSSSKQTSNNPQGQSKPSNLSRNTPSLLVVANVSPCSEEDQSISPRPSHETGSSPEGSFVKHAVSREGGVAWKAKVEWKNILKQSSNMTPPPPISLSPHSPLSSDMRPKKSPHETKLASEERHARAVQIREALASEKKAKLSKYNNNRQEAARSSTQGRGEVREQMMSKVEEKLARSAELRQQHLQSISHKAGEESRKVAEVAFINQIVEEDKKVSLQQKLEEEESRLREKRRAEEAIAKAKGTEKAKEEEEVHGRRKEQEIAKARELEEKLVMKAQREERALARLEEERRAQTSLREAMRERQALLLGQKTAELKRQQEMLGERIEERLREAALRRQARLELIRDRAALTTGLGSTPPSSPSRIPFSPRPTPSSLAPNTTGADKVNSGTEVKGSKHLSASAAPFIPSPNSQLSLLDLPSVKAPTPVASSQIPLRSSDGSITAARSADSRLRGMRKRAAKIASQLRATAEAHRESSQEHKTNKMKEERDERSKFLSMKSISSASKEWKRLVKMCYLNKNAPQGDIPASMDKESEGEEGEEGGRVDSLALVPLGSPSLSSLLTSVQSLIQIEEEVTKASRGHISKLIRWLAHPLGVMEVCLRIASSPYPDDLSLSPSASASSPSSLSEAAAQVIKSRRIILQAFKVLAAEAPEAPEAPSPLIDILMDLVACGLAPPLAKGCMKELDAYNSISSSSQQLSAQSPSKRQSPRSNTGTSLMVSDQEDPQPPPPPVHLTLLLDLLSLILRETKAIRSCSDRPSLHSLLISLLLSCGLVGRCAEMLSLMDGPLAPQSRGGGDSSSNPSSPCHSRKISGGNSSSVVPLSQERKSSLALVESLSLSLPPPPPIPTHIMSVLTFLEELTSACPSSHGASAAAHRNNPNAPAISLALQETNLAGLPSMLTAILLAAAPTCKPSEAELHRLPDEFTKAATLVMRSLNNAARLDLPSLQSSLSGSNGLGVEFLHLAAFLLSFCGSQIDQDNPEGTVNSPQPDASKASFNLLFELLLLIAHFAVGSEVNQSMLTWGRSVQYSVIHGLCSLPLPCINHSAIRGVWAACLVVTSHENMRVRDLVLSYTSPRWIKMGIDILTRDISKKDDIRASASNQEVARIEPKVAAGAVARVSYAKALTAAKKVQNETVACLPPSLHSIRGLVDRLERDVLGDRGGSDQELGEVMSRFKSNLSSSAATTSPAVTLRSS